MKENVLVVNSGSSSIKYQLVNPKTAEALCTGLIERIGEQHAKITHKPANDEFEWEGAIKNHGEGLKLMIQMFTEHGPKLSEDSLIGVGHRVVQGGSVFADSAVVDDDVLAKIKALSDLAPLHNPANAEGIEVARKLFANTVHVAVFDSQFFANLPASAKNYALNKVVADKYQIKRYGAHGTSHKFVGEEVKKLLEVSDEQAKSFKQIVLHLGNGASASAQLGSKAIDTSMGLTPLQGLVMGTRTGDIDPAAVFHLARVANMQIDEIDTLLNKKSGVMGIAGVSDMRDLHALVEKGDENAQLALDVYIHRLVFYVGAYAALLGGLDALTFTAGIGENDAKIRKLVCDRLGIFGVQIDDALNNERSKNGRIVSTADSKVKVIVLPTNEELAIAKEVEKLA